MRFAYIDSNGNEVPIPSVDALALRIELGAISDDTQLYDAQADQWGPAHSHEIFHTLQRDAKEGDGFVAPPPAASPPVASDVSVDEAPPDGRSGAEVGGTAAETPPEPSIEAAAESEGPDEPEDESFGLTLAEAPAEPVEDGGLPDFDFEAPEDPHAESAGPAEHGRQKVRGGREVDEGHESEVDEGHERDDEALMDLSAAAANEDIGFDFDMSGGIGLEDALDDPVAESSDPQPMIDEAPQAELDGEMELETAAHFDTSAFDTGEDSGLDLETPMSRFSPEAPPSWMGDDEEHDDDDAMDFSVVGAVSEEEDEDDVPLRERRTPRNKPSKPKLRKQTSYAAPLVLVAFVVAVGVGGYVAWPLVSDRLLGEGEPEVAVVTLPPLSEALMPAMRSVSDDALAAAFEDVREAWAASGPVEQPPSDWLAGVYLANASRYPAVDDFWSGVGDFLDGVRRIDLATFDAKVEEELSRRGMSAADAAAIRARADSGFVAGGPDRQGLYDRFGTLVEASRDLHRFLVANEADIAYAPASAVTTDPVLEVNPETAELRDAMERLLDSVTDMLSRLEYRDRVTAEGLREVLRRRTAEQGIR